MHPDWGAIQCIVRTVRSLGTGSSYSVKRIKNHQDDQQPVRELSLAARLNCDGDKLAGEFQSSFYRRPIVTMIAGTGAQLFIGSKWQLQTSNTERHIPATILCIFGTTIWLDSRQIDS